MNRKVGILNQVDKSPTPEQVYGRWFLSAFVSNTTLMLAVSLMFRYSDFVASIGGNAADLGWITGLGTAGALCVRVIQGDAIDRLGVRVFWGISMGSYVLSLVLHTQIQTATGIPVYLVSVSYTHLTLPTKA